MQDAFRTHTFAGLHERGNHSSIPLIPPEPKPKSRHSFGQMEYLGENHTIDSSGRYSGPPAVPLGKGDTFYPFFHRSHFCKNWRKRKTCHRYSIDASSKNAGANFDVT
jgi:hypothetical protein